MDVNEASYNLVSIQQKWQLYAISKLTAVTFEECGLFCLLHQTNECGWFIHSNPDCILGNVERDAAPISGLPSLPNPTAFLLNSESTKMIIVLRMLTFTSLVIQASVRPILTHRKGTCS